jgi:ribulose-phosphate 3-epimerase
MRIHPAPLVETKAELQRQLDAAKAYTDKIDIDLVDWSRTSGKTVSAAEALDCDTGSLELFFDLMLDYPGRVLSDIASDTRVAMVTINLALKEDIYDLIKQVTSAGKFAGISVNPEQNLADFEDLLELVEHVQIMTVEPGAQGNKFLSQRLSLANELKSAGFNGTIGIDGGVNPETLPVIMEYPLDILSVGSALSKAKDPAAVYKQMLELINSYEQEHSEAKLPASDLTE